MFPGSWRKSANSSSETYTENREKISPMKEVFKEIEYLLSVVEFIFNFIFTI